MVREVTRQDVERFHQDGFIVFEELIDSYQAWHEPGDVVTCWIALEGTRPDGGTLEYVRGSHKWPRGPRIEQFAAPPHYHSMEPMTSKPILVRSPVPLCSRAR